MKLASFEDLKETTKGAPFDIPPGIEIPDMLSLLAFHDPNATVTGLDSVPPDDRPPVGDRARVVPDDGRRSARCSPRWRAVFLYVRVRRRRLPESRWFWRATIAAGPLSVVALIAGWVTTEVGRQPWVVYGVMRTEDAVTGAGGIPVGYATLAIVYAGVLAAVVWILRRLARAPARGGRAGGRAGGRRRWLRSRSILILVGLAAYTVLGGADFGAGLWELTARGKDGKALRDHTHRSMAPVWEANHVWLIFVLVMAWTCYPEAFASIVSTLTIPLFVAAVGIILRGASLRAARRQLDAARGGRDQPAVRVLVDPDAVRARAGRRRDRLGPGAGRQRGQGDEVTSW